MARNRTQHDLTLDAGEKITQRPGGGAWTAKGWWRDPELAVKYDETAARAEEDKRKRYAAAKVAAKASVKIRKKPPGEVIPAQVINVRKTDESNDAAVAVQNIARWRKDPVLFVREVLKAEPDDWQLEFLRALVTHDKIALKACKGPGKSCGLAWAILWFMNCFTHAKILCTSITGQNLRDGLWSEVNKWHKQSEMLMHLFEHQSERYYAKEHPQTWFVSARTWSKDADKSKQADTLAGQHAQHTMIVVDEAGDIPESVVAAGLAHHSTQDPDRPEVHKTLMAGNPTRLDGALGVACTRDRATWWVKEITGDPDDPRRAKRISVDWAREQIATWGRENAWVLVNVFGQFPPTQADKLLGVEQVRTAMGRNPEEKVWINEPMVLGIDVARQGDDRSVVFARRGRVAFRPWIFRIDDTMELASRVARIIDQHEPDAAFIDGTGIGAGVFDRLVQLGYDVIEVQFGSKPQDGKRFLNRRAEMWWTMAEWVKEHGALPDVGDLIPELTGPTYWFNATDKLCLESKEDMKLRGMASPDLADALALTFATRVLGKKDHEAQVIRLRARMDWDPLAPRES